MKAKCQHHKPLYTNLPRTICRVCGCILVQSSQGNWHTIQVIKVNKVDISKRKC